MTTYRLFTGALLVSVSSLACAAYADDVKDTVVITGLRFGQTEVESGTAAYVITAEDIERRGLTTAGEAIALAPGVTVTSSGSFGGVSYARMRGHSPGQALVLVDGVPVNDVASPGGGFDFSHFDLGDVERIEVLRGPQSTLWGTDAIGGVISIVTKAPQQGFGFKSFAEAGSFSTVRAGMTASGASDTVDGAMSAVWKQSDGISKADENNGATEDDGYKSLSLSGRAGVRLAEGVRADFAARWNDAVFDLDGFPAPDYVLADTAATSISETLSASATLTAVAFGGNLENVLQVAYFDLNREDDDGEGFMSATAGDRAAYRYSGQLQIAEGHRAGFGAEQENSRANDEEADSSSLFGFYEWSPTTAFVFTGGLRYDDDERYGSETTGKLAASWEVSDTVRLRATWGQGFKAPTIFQSTYICGFCGLTEPNADLKAETSEGFDLGVDWDIGQARLSLTVFDTETENMIDFSDTEGYANIALAKQRGAEAEALLPLTNWLGLTAVYTYIEAENGVGGELPRVPEHSGNIGFVFAPEGPFSGALTARYNGDQSDGFGPRMPEWTRVDAAAAWAFSPGAEIYVRVENLFDEEYQSIGGYGTPGVSGYFGIRVRG